MNLLNNTYLVTGGSRGLGEAIVRKLVAFGANVLFTYCNSSQRAEALAAELNEQGPGQAKAFQADATAPEAANAAIDETINTFGQLDGIVNNAGITKDSAFYRMKNEDWQSVMNTNLNGVFYLSKAYLEKAIRFGKGKIVNMSSVSGIKGMKGQANYCASKGGIIALTKSLAVEYARFNIQVNALAPGYIQTDMVEEMDGKVRNKLTKSIPLKRLGTPTEVANTTAFLLSDWCDYMTGQTIVIDGGLSI